EKFKSFRLNRKERLMAKKKKKVVKSAKRSQSRAKEKTVTVEAVVKFVKRLDELQHLDEFLELVQGSKAFVTLRGRSYDVVKRFVDQRRGGGETLQTRAAGAAESGRIDPCPEGFRCF